ncbi:MAG: F0F1 ATP synthase subunit A [Planctomycetia bacterium]|nr:F0F1 ATP synthase subunit A [Planctomycetia bacterium]
MSAEQNPLSPGWLGGHVGDGTSFHFFTEDQVLHLPEIFGIQITKFMVLEIIAAVVMLAFFIPLAKKIKSGEPIKGRFWNFLEVFLLFFRDNVVRPSIGHGADKYLPIIWTTFFFILFCNLFGLIPFGGSPTANPAVTAVLALVAFCATVIAGSMKFGLVNFWTNQVPDVEVPFGLGVVLKPMLFVIEVMGLFIKHIVLAIRLFANVFAGHLVMAVFMAFVGAVAGYILIWLAVAPASMALYIAIFFLEIFVSFLQAYIFSFLMALFIGMGTHKH